MNEVKWIKIAVDIFDNRKIKQIEKLPEGDAIIVIWLQLLCLAGLINENGFIVMTKDIAYTDELLANAFNRSLTVIRLALDIFVKFGMIELVDDVICISNWEKYQNADKLLAIREYNKIAKQKEREKKRLLIGNVIDKSLTSQGQSIDCQDTDIEIDRERDKERDIKKESIKKEKTTQIPPPIDDVRTYCQERKNNIDADKWFAYYEMKGWLVGKTKMKDWKAAVRYWESQ